MIEIYTDMSLFNYKFIPTSFGIAYLMIDKNEDEILYAENVKFETLHENNILLPHQVKNINLLEEYAILVALRDCDTPDQEIVIYTDSEHFFILHHQQFTLKKKHRKHIQENRVYPEIMKEIERLKGINCNVDIRCIKGHKNVYGNAKVNNHANKFNLTYEERVRNMAYNIWLDTGNPNEEENWLQAEKSVSPYEYSLDFKLAHEIKHM